MQMGEKNRRLHSRLGDFLCFVFGVSVWILKDMSKLKMVVKVGVLEKDKRCNCEGLGKFKLK